MLIVSCDNIDENDRYLAVDKPVTPPHSVTKKLLIQEFTGMRCTNCPDGAGAIHDIKNAYPNQVISVGLHPQNNVNTRPRNGLDLTSAEASVMYEYYRPSGFPCALFNGGDLSTSYSTWFTLATEAITQPARMTIEPETLFDVNDRYLTVNYTVSFTDNISENLSVMVWIMENNIIGSQLSHGEWIEDYVHNHVLRASLNGAWGEELKGNYENGNSVLGTASMQLNEDWVPENCQVIVYVFQTDSKTIEQSEIVDVAII